MNRAKIERDVLLKLFNDAIDGLKAIADKPANVEDVGEVNDLLNIVEVHWPSIEALSKAIQDAIPDTNTTNELHDECELLGKARSQRIRAKGFAERFIKSFEQPKSPARSNSRRAVKLPVLPIRRFNGNIYEWREFWASFEIVDRDEDLTESEKMRYLISYLDDEPRRTVENIGISSLGYREATRLLKEQYARTDILIHGHLGKLNNLKPVTSASDAVALRSLYNECEVNVRALTCLGENRDNYKSAVAQNLFGKLPHDIRFAWTTDPSHSLTDLDGILAHLKKYVEGLERCNVGSPRSDPKPSTSSASKPDTSRVKPVVPTAAGLAVSVNAKACLFCKSADHNLLNCPKSLDEKRNVVRRQARCLNCLGAGHTFDQCASQHRCRKCNQAHHTSLHPDAVVARPSTGVPVTSAPRTAAPVSPVPAPSATVLVPSSSTGAIPKTTAPRATSSIAVVQSPPASTSVSEPSPDRVPDEPVVIATSLAVTQLGQDIASKTHLLKAASVFVVHGDKREKARVVLDDGSQRTAVRLSLVQRLGLKASGQELLEIDGIGGAADSLTRRPAFELSLLPRGGTEAQRATPFRLYAVGVETIPVSAPRVPDGDWLNEVKALNLMLADEVYDSGVPGPIDIIIGSDQYNSALHQREMVELANGVAATNSVFGWVLTGGVDEAREQSRKVAAMFMNFRPGSFDEQVREDLRDTWGLQSIGVMPTVEKPIPLEKHPVYEEFSQTVTRDGDRYEVQLPWKKNRPPLPSNRKLAERRLVGLLTRLRARPELLQAYDGVFKDHLRRGFIEKVPDDEVDNPKHEVHYLPHHGVERKDKPSSPIRVVFNASAHEKDSPSLNNLLEIGPKTQADQLEINLLFRVHRVAVTADIDKAFLQISLAEPDRDAVRFLWFVNPFDPNTEVVHYRYRRVAFGLGPSPFLLGAVLHHHLKSYDERLPAVRALKRQRFVDDLISGAHTEQEALQLCRDARKICCEAGFPLGKFHSNSTSVREQLQPSEVVSSDCDVPPVTKMLGLVWRLQQDDLSLNVESLLEFRSVTRHVPTKRILLMTAHQLFDQMGLVTPITIVSHILLQQCWCRGLGWDDPLPEDILKQWNSWCDSLNALNELFIPRWIFTNRPGNTKYSLHLFCDASEKAYGVVAYLIREDGTPVVLTSRARVAPLERVTLARLELLACLIGARLQSYLRQVFDQFQFDVTMWSDSQVAINWIKTPTHRLKTFVANRVQEIQQLTQPGVWRHCAGVDNPADLCSRGSSADQLIQSSLWWSGPAWLKSFSSSSPFVANSHDLSEREQAMLTSELKPDKVSVGLIVADSSFSVWASRFSSLMQLLRVTAWIQRFISNWRKPAEERVTTELTADDIRNAKHWWIRRVQKDTFPADFHRLAKKKQPKQPSPLVGCGRVVLTDDETICLQGRLGIESRPPNLVPILPSNHPFTSLLISDAHQRLSHSWVSITVDQLSHDYHILRARQAVLKELKRCMRCRIMRTAPIRPPPGALPAVRRTPGEPFEATGVDFFGPLYVKSLDHRSTYKVYGCLFTCARTRAIHMEVVTDLRTPTFLMALQRFIARRGRCLEMYSDNAKTFEKASRDIAAAFRRLRSCPSLKAHFASQGITWHFIPERAPWWGGFWERLVGVVKMPLRTVIGKACLTEPELTTKLLEVEVAVNSRPITHLSVDNRDPAPLSPAMLLNGRSPALLPPLNVTKPAVLHYNADDCRDRFAYLESISDKYWKFFNTGYLRLLRTPLPGQPPVRTVEPGDFVLVHDDHSARPIWNTGRVLQVFPSKIDGIVRSALIKLPSAQNPIRRAVNHLYLLETVGDSVRASPGSRRPSVGASPAASGSSDDADHLPEDGFDTPDGDDSASDDEPEVNPESRHADTDSDSSQDHQKSPSPTRSLGEEPVVKSTRSGRQRRPNRRYPDTEWDLGR